MSRVSKKVKTKFPNANFSRVTIQENLKENKISRENLVIIGNFLI